MFYMSQSVLQVILEAPLSFVLGFALAYVLEKLRYPVTISTLLYYFMTYFTMRKPRVLIVGAGLEVMALT